MKGLKQIIACFLSAAVIAPAVPSSIVMAENSEQPIEIKVENLVNPIGIDSEKPIFSWRVESVERGYEQNAYQILVASSEENLNNDNGDIWDSGKVMSSQQYAVEYEGDTLESSTEYFWKAKVYDEEDAESDWSEIGTFETGLLDRSEWTGKLIGGENIEMVRREIEIPSDKEIKSARAYMSSLGYCELHINGEKIGDHILDPVWTNPDYRLLYPTFDVTKKLQSGTNTLGLVLGFGGVTGSINKYAVMQLRVDYTDGTNEIFVTDETWKCTADGPISGETMQNEKDADNGPLLYSESLYYGEFYDARNEADGWDKNGFDDSGWDAVDTMDIGSREMTAQLVPITVSETITPVSVNKLSDGSYIFDLGKNISGTPIITGTADEGTEVTMTISELLKSNGDINPNTTTSSRRKYLWRIRYTFNGDGGESFEPTFTMSGFRYIKVEIKNSSWEPTADNIKANVITSEVEKIGGFTSSNDTLNQLHDMYVLSQQANMSMGTLTDCPHRERLGWLGDAMLMANAVTYNFDAENFLSKWFDDMDDQALKAGVWHSHLPFATSWELNDFDVPWFSANIIVPWEVYRRYGNKNILEDSYERMAALIEYLGQNSNNYLINKNGNWRDWLSPIGTDNVNSRYLGSAYYYRCADLMAQIAAELGKTDDAEKYAALAENIKNAVNNTYFYDGNHYDSGTQTANAVALDFGIVPEEKRGAVMQNLIDDIVKNDYHMTTGIPGTYNLFSLFRNTDYADIMYRMLNQESYPGFGYMMRYDVTTPWEQWWYGTGTGESWNHAFLAAPADSWMNEAAAGITEIGAGYKEFQIKPAVVDDLTNATGSFDSVYGLIKSDWKREDNKVTLKVTVPPNTKAHVYVPTIGAAADSITITESGNDIWKDNAAFAADGITYKSTETEYIVYEVKSGEYEFVMTADSDVNPQIRHEKLDTDDVKITGKDYFESSGASTHNNAASSLDSGDYIAYENVDLTDVSRIIVNIGSKLGNNKAIDFRLDSPTGEIISTLYIIGNHRQNNGAYHIEETMCTRTEGIHDIYLTFRGGEDVAWIEWIQFAKGSSSDIASVEPVNLYAAKGDENPVVPGTVITYDADNTIQKRKVIWDAAVNTSQTEKTIITGTVDGTVI